MEVAAGRLAACVGASLAASRWLQQQQRQRGRPQLPQPHRPASLAARCEQRHWQLNREAFISGREFLDVHSLYLFKESIGEGGFGKVFQATHRRTGTLRAIKVIPKRDNVEEVKNELAALIELDHPHIVRLIEYFEDQARFYLVQALCDGPDLAEMMREATGGRSRVGERTGPLPEREVSIVMRDCLKSVIGCHSHGFVHRDIKLDNFMVTGQEGIVKMIDFGLAVQKADLTEAAGTSIYRAPEMMIPAWRRRLSAEGRETSSPTYDKAVDVWSLGVMLFSLLTGESLFKRTLDARSVRDRLVDPKFVQDRLRHCQALKGCSEEGRDLLSRMLQHDPVERISTTDALHHPFIQRTYYETLDQNLHPSTEEEPPVDTALLTKFSDFARAPRLRQIAILAMTHLLTEQSDHHQDLKSLRHMFRILDQDGDGQISLQELRRLEEYGVAIPADLADVFSACDVNGTGNMNYVEFFACGLPSSMIDEGLCTEAFLLLDRNFSGRLEADDLQLLMRKSPRVFGMEEYEAIIQEAELAVKHGAEGSLAFQDFHLFLRGEKPTASQPQARPPAAAGP